MGDAEGLSGEVPQGNVHHAYRRAVGVTQTALQVVVGPLTLEGILSDEIAGDGSELACRSISGSSHVLSDDACVRVDPHDAVSRRENPALLVDLVEAVIVGPHIVDLVLEHDELDLGDLWLGHWPPPLCQLMPGVVHGH